MPRFTKGSPEAIAWGKAMREKAGIKAKKGSPQMKSEMSKLRAKRSKSKSTRKCGCGKMVCECM